MSVFDTILKLKSDKHIKVHYFIYSRRMILLAMPMILNGMELGFLYGEFTTNYVGESLGGKSIGYIMGIFGAVAVVGSYAVGRICDRCKTLLILPKHTQTLIDVQVWFMARHACRYNDILCSLYAMRIFECVEVRWQLGVDGWYSLFACCRRCRYVFT